MTKKRLLLLGIIVLAIPVTYANKIFNQRIFNSALEKDTTVQATKAVAVASKINSQNGFNDLYINTVYTPDASNGSRLNPRAVSFVQDYIEKNQKDLQNMKSWGRPYFNLIDGILAQYGLPRELKYLAVIESQLKPTSVSWAGAVGPWQLMPQTARLLGLKVTHRYDERTNYYKSTRAAAKYLRDLYTEFGDWLLVIAAYNGGSAHVYSAMHKSGSRNFWDLQYYLPAESRNHVKKFIGTHYIFEGQGGITTLTKDEATEQLSGSSMYVFHRKLSKEELNNSKTISVSGKYHSSVIAKYVVMDIDEFARYNPEFDKVMASTNNTYELKLPADKMELFIANKYQILNESVQMLLNDAADDDSTVPKTAVAKRDGLK
ncbi:MAG: lytic transglycosylase domain-containing protein [Bacteroidetes bacterium]|nr:lytic transglycosylase domain-containing protein [Bacteroidota bacterium]MBS1932552.1 lytic transglycosylase domain-containing protein [Bacteroidota bacterium]